MNKKRVVAIIALNKNAAKLLKKRVAMETKFSIGGVKFLRNPPIYIIEIKHFNKVTVDGMERSWRI